MEAQMAATLGKIGAERARDAGLGWPTARPDRRQQGLLSHLHGHDRVKGATDGQNGRLVTKTDGRGSEKQRSRVGNGDGARRGLPRRLEIRSRPHPARRGRPEVCGKKNVILP